ncbi:CheY-like superfamily [Ochromonadaceae sp. CCMP2298]|nr:CheY-like superfamily [Ochromonadaceae sp. CCMP2298]
MEAQPEEEKETANTNPIKEKTVLIVEDHREIRRYIDNLLNKEYHTLQAKNGEEALTILKSEKVDIIISDLMMPYIDGFELLKQLKAEENYAHIPVLIVSARTNEEDKLEILKLGAEEIIAKPFTPSEIKLRLQNLLSKAASNNSVLHLFDPSNVKSGVEHIISEKVKQLILEHIDDSNLSVMDFCEVLAASERKVFRLIKKIFNLTPLELIKETRWQFLDTLLKSGTKMSASEAGRSIGMRNVTNFKKQFEDRFGKPYAE